MVPLIVIAAVVILVGVFVWLTYNRFVARRQAVDNSWAQIEAALKRRHDLIPNLVESVKGYATHEQTTFTQVTEARTAAQAAKSPDDAAAAEGVLGAALGRLMATAEAYPELRATENFQQLQNELSETENQIQITRRVYNDTVQTYNTGIQIFPPNLVAKAFNFDARAFFDAPDEATVTPEVDFTGQSGGGQPGAEQPGGAQPAAEK